MVRGKKAAALGLGVVLAACGGHSTHEGFDGYHGGSGGGEVGGASGGVNAGAAGGTAGAGNASGSGGVNAQGGAGELGGAGATFGGAPSAGESGSAGRSGANNSGGGSAPVIDHSHARFPIPNSVYSGLPHPISYDKSVTGVVHDNVTGLTWRADVPEPLTWNDGMGFCAAQTLAGKDDWRLPTRIELVTLMAAIEEDNVVTSGAFPTAGQPGGYWSSSLVEDDFDMNHWIVWLGYDYDYSSTVDKLLVRCVRSDDALVTDPTPPGFVVMGDVVKDTGTGLTWERSPPAVWRTRADSFAYCTNLKLGGLISGWRLSSMPELLTLPGLNGKPPRIDAVLFPDVDVVTYGWFWTTTVSRLPSDTGATVVPSYNLGYGTTSRQYEQESWLVRCVHD